MSTLRAIWSCLESRILGRVGNGDLGLAQLMTDLVRDIGCNVDDDNRC